MKPTPLKNKYCSETECTYHKYHEEDVRAAVEWLKEKLNDATPSYIIRTINEAFEDVIKEEVGE